MCDQHHSGIPSTAPENYERVNIDIISLLTPSDLGSSDARLSDLWGWHDNTTGRDYAIVGMNDGTAFVDVTNEPIVLGRLPTNTGKAIWRDIKTHDNYAYIVADNNGKHGVQIFDLTQLREPNESKLFNANAVFTGVHNAHNLAIHDGYAYIVGGVERLGRPDTKTIAEGGLYILDLSDPLDPKVAGEFPNDGYTHDSQVVTYEGPDLEYKDRSIAFNSNVDSLSIVDVTDKSNLQKISDSSYPYAAYIHQGWLSEDHRYFFVNDEYDEIEKPLSTKTQTHIWNIEDLDNPLYQGFHEGNEVSIDHNLYIKGDLMFQANYSSGMRLLEIKQPSGESKPVQLKEIAYLDTDPSSDSETFSGAWSVYPFFDDNKAIVSDTQGLFVINYQTIKIEGKAQENETLTAINSVPIVVMQ